MGLAENQNNKQNNGNQQGKKQQVEQTPEVKVAPPAEQPKELEVGKTEQSPITPEATPAIVDPTSTPDATKVPEENEKQEEVEVITSLADLYKVLHTIEESELSDTYKRFKSVDNGENLFVAELIDIHNALSINSEATVVKGNALLNSLLLRVIDAADKVRFNVINKIFDISKNIYEPAYLQRSISFTRSQDVAINYGLLVTIIEILSNVETRAKNKAQVADLSRLKIGDNGINFIKSYYKL